MREKRQERPNVLSTRISLELPAPCDAVSWPPTGAWWSLRSLPCWASLIIPSRFTCSLSSGLSPKLFQHEKMHSTFTTKEQAEGRMGKAKDRGQRGDSKTKRWNTTEGWERAFCLFPSRDYFLHKWQWVPFLLIGLLFWTFDGWVKGEWQVKESEDWGGRILRWRDQGRSLSSFLGQERIKSKMGDNEERREGFHLMDWDSSLQRLLRAQDRPKSRNWK